MCPVIYNRASCKIRAVIRLLHAKNMRAAKIHCELCTVYGQNIMSEGTVRHRCRMFKDGRGRTGVHDEERSGQLSVVSDYLVQSVDQKICERQRFTFSKLSCEFPQISRTVVYEITTVRLGCHKFCARWAPKIFTGVHRTQRMALTFLERYHKDGDEFLSHVVRVTGDETWVSFVNAEIEEQSKQ
jgi:hypothetical protein